MRPGAVELHEHVRHLRVGNAVQVAAGGVAQRLAQVALPAARLRDDDEHLVVLDPLAAGVPGDAVSAELPVGQVDDVLYAGRRQLEARLAVELGDLALPPRRGAGRHARRGPRAARRPRRTGPGAGRPPELSIRLDGQDRVLHAGVAGKGAQGVDLRARRLEQLRGVALGQAQDVAAGDERLLHHRPAVEHAGDGGLGLRADLGGP